MAAAVVVVGVAATGWWWSTRAISVSVVEVSAREVVEVYVATGQVRSRKASLVGTELPGRVREVLVEPGDRPKQGEVLVELQPIDAKIAVEQAEARVAIVEEEYERIKRGPTPAQLRTARAGVQSAKVDVDEAERELARLTQLRRAGLETTAAVDRAETDVRRAKTRLSLATSQLAELREQPRLADLRVAQARIDEAKKNLQQIRTNLGKTVISAPFHGLVLAVDVAVGEQVSAGQGLVRLAEMDNLEVYAELDEAYFGRLAPNMKATYVFPSLPDARYSGSVRQVGPEVDGARGVVGVHLDAEALPELAVPGLTVDVVIELQRFENATAIPRSALIRDDQGTAAFVIEGGEARRTDVAVLAEGEDYFAIEGLPVGTMLVKDGTVVEGGESVVMSRDD